ncbi:hypothetical protein [Aeromicrobium sp. UC242_57]|uniref:hypothetical protein n=1 Tax=Aeromicrobium sp. UC242_57 TaxID=3374624 RepID=UPI0037AC9503
MNNYATVVNWEDIPIVDVRPGVRRRIYTTDQVMFAWHSLDVGMQTNPHSHEDFDQRVHRRGPVRLLRQRRAAPDGAGLVHAGAGRRGALHRPIEGPCINIDVFTPPRADFLP